MWVFSPDGTDDGATFQSTLQGAWMDFGNPIFWKYLIRLKLIGRGKFNLQLKRNFQNAVYFTKVVDMSSGQDTWNIADLWGAGTWGPDSNVKERLLGLDAYGRSFAICVTDAEVTTGTSLLPVGSVDVPLTLGEWALFQAALDGFQLGLRG